MSQYSPPSDRAGFQIAIICALKVEADAMMALFDDYWDEHVRYGKARHDPNAYTTGRVGEHNVVLAHMAGMGTLESASLAASFLSSFPNIELGLVVGLCGGVPFDANGNEIILGDIIISTGLVQYDFARQYLDRQETRHTLDDRLGRQSRGLRSFVSKLNSFIHLRRLCAQTKIFLEQIQDIEEFRRSVYLGVNEDKLYAPTYRHTTRCPHSCNICSLCTEDSITTRTIAESSTCEQLGCSSEYLIRRQRLSHSHPQHLIHFGKMGSGNSVIKSAVHRDHYAAKDQLIAFEMEGAGIWDTFPSLVIKSVVDYSDSHKSKSWQMYCSARAAACTKALLLEWSTKDPFASSGLPATTQSSRPLRQSQLSSPASASASASASAPQQTEEELANEAPPPIPLSSEASPTAYSSQIISDIVLPLTWSPHVSFVNDRHYCNLCTGERFSSRTQGLIWRHVSDEHHVLPHTNRCPFPDCSTAFVHRVLFLRHLTRSHGILSEDM